MQLSQNLNESLITDFYINHRSWVYSLLCKKLGSTNDAADLTQDTFVSILSINDLSIIVEPRAYLTTIAHRLMVNHVRRSKIEEAFLDAVALLSENETPSPESISISLEALIQIDHILSGLSKNVRYAFLLNHLEGLSHGEIAQRLNVSKASVRKYLAKALDKCISINQA